MNKARAMAELAVRKIEYDITDREGLADDWDKLTKGEQQEVLEKWRDVIEQSILEVLGGTR